MSNQNQNQWSNLKQYHAGLAGQETHLETWIEAFLIDRKAQNMTPGTLYFYRAKLQLFARFCETRAITHIDQLTPDDLRRYMLHLQDTGHNPGGCHCAYRAIKTFLRWFEEETEPGPEWRNPIKKVKPPKNTPEQLDPLSMETFELLTSVCGNNFTGRRDLALMHFLLDTGARATECLSINLADVNPITGEVRILLGKGRKFRKVYLGKKTRRALRHYLKMRKDDSPALWVGDEGERWSYDGMRSMFRRRADLAGIPAPTPHSFRRAFALTCLRNGMDIYSLQELMGHADLQVLRRYLKQSDEDLQAAHQRSGPVDHLDRSG